MTQNRNKLLGLFVGNLSNAILHKILENAITDKNIANKYEKELTTSFALAMKYREKINPSTALPEKDIEYVKHVIMKRVTAELLLRIARGYTNLSCDSVEEIVDDFLRQAKVKENV